MGIALKFSCKKKLEEPLLNKAKTILALFNDQARGVRAQFAGMNRQSFTLFYGANIPHEFLHRSFSQIIKDLTWGNEFYIGSITTGINFNQAGNDQIITRHQCMLDRANIKISEIPEEYICALTGLVMDEPVLLPSNHYVEKKVILVSLSDKAEDPFTRLPLSSETITVSKERKKVIQEHVFQLMIRDLKEEINEFITLHAVHQDGYMSFEGNPYGKDAQRYQVPSSFDEYSIGVTRTQKSPQGQLIAQYRFKEVYKHLNYPCPNKTEQALRDAFFALDINDMEQFERIRLCYPCEAAKCFFRLQKRHSNNVNYYESAPPRPHTLQHSFFLEPSRKRQTDIEPIYFNPAFSSS